MAGTVTAIVLTVSLLFGSAGAVYAAQDSLPDQALYPVKILSEDARLGLAANPQQEMELALAFADRRVGELAALAQAGEPLPEQVGLRLEKHLNFALQAAAGLEDPEIGPALLQARARMQEQERILSMNQANGPLGNEPVIARVQARLRLQIGLAELGLQDPVAFRLRLRQNATATEPPLETDEPALTAEPGSGYGPGPQRTPGCPDCTPEGDANSYGPGPNNQGATSQPNEGYGPGPDTGPGPAATRTVEPPQDGNGNPSNSNQGDNSNQGGNGGGNGGGDGGGNGH